MKVLSGERIYLQEASFEDWLNSHRYIYSEEMSKYDVSNRHIPSINILNMFE
ncbi:hypothetical protein KAX35_00010 [candidate division WOR-3 bacterium]|nr:hypothetical protein [candidate division WOR-3 bacterium]MCK4328530.1 hypothetical protein [candidate division WOR-3 bacterium]